jgi:hypothetical protein
LSLDLSNGEFNNGILFSGDSCINSMLSCPNNNLGENPIKKMRAKALKGNDFMGKTAVDFIKNILGRDVL